MRVLIAGCWRSGTTALYNIVRLICEAHGRTYACFEDAYDEEDGSNFDFEIVKVHKFSHEWVHWSDIIFTIWRDPGDVLDSMRRFWPEMDDSEIIERFGRGLTWFGLYNRKASYEAHFNQLSRSPEALAKKVSRQMGLSIREKEIIKQLRAIKLPEVGQDPVTLLHSNHITSDEV